METTPIHRGPSRHRSLRCFSPAAIRRFQLINAWLIEFSMIGCR